MISTGREHPDELAGQLLRQARDRAGLTQREVALRAGVPQPTISAYENSRRQPTVPMLVKLLRATDRNLTVGLCSGEEEITTDSTGPTTGPNHRRE